MLKTITTYSFVAKLDNSEGRHLLNILLVHRKD